MVAQTGSAWCQRGPVTTDGPAVEQQFGSSSGVRVDEAGIDGPGLSTVGGHKAGPRVPALREPGTRGPAPPSQPPRAGGDFTPMAPFSHLPVRARTLSGHVASPARQLRAICVRLGPKPMTGTRGGVEPHPFQPSGWEVSRTGERARPKRVVVVDAENPLQGISGEFFWREDHERILAQARHTAHTQGCADATAAAQASGARSVVAVADGRWACQANPVDFIAHGPGCRRGTAARAPRLGDECVRLAHSVERALRGRASTARSNVARRRHVDRCGPGGRVAKPGPDPVRGLILEKLT